MTEPASVRNDDTVSVHARVPRSLIGPAAARLPGLSQSSVVRVALARLAGIDSDQFTGNLRPGPKSRKPT